MFFGQGDGQRPFYAERSACVRYADAFDILLLEAIKTIVVHCRKGERLQTAGSSVCSPATTLTGMFMQGSSCIFSIFQGCLYKNITIKNIQARFLQGKKSSGQRYDKTKPNNHTEIALRSPQEASSIVPLFHSVGSISANLLFFTKLNSHSVINIVMMIKLGGGPIRSPNDLSPAPPDPALCLT